MAGSFNPLDVLLSRDREVQRRLDANNHPMAELTATSIDSLTAPLVEGRESTAKVLGNLSIRGMTRAVTFDTKATFRGDVLSGTASTSFNMTDFGVQPPAITGVVVEDAVTIVVEFTATRT